MQPVAIVEALGIRVALPVLMRALPLDRVLHTITPRTGRSQPREGDYEAIEHATELVTRLTRTACLKRAMMRYRMLRRGGYDASFVIGVRPGGEDGFEAHAWVTLDGEPVMEKEPVDYRATFVWPPSEGAQSVTQSVTGAP